MQHKLFAGQVVADGALGDRQIRVVANSGRSDRVKDVLVAKGCHLENYSANPIVLADHDPTKPIGNFEPEIKDERVEGIITFAPAGVSAKADEYCGLYKAGVLKTVSVGFREIAAEPIKGGGYRFAEWELMELSCVAVPCDPGAVVTARTFPHGEERASARVSNHANTDFFNWKCAASRNLPVLDQADFDPDAAAERILAKAGFGGERFDAAWARKGFLVYDAAEPRSKRAYYFPIADVIDGRLVAVKSALDGARRRADELPDDARETALAVLADYDARAKAGAAVPGQASPPRLKSVYDVARLAYLLGDLGYVQDGAVFEAEIEQDSSKVPGMLADALRALADAFLAMTQEEVAELLADRDVEIAGPDADDDSLPDQTKRIRAAFRKAGRAVSAESAGHLEDALDCISKAAGHIETACDHVKNVHARANPQQDDDEANDELSAPAARAKRMLLAASMSR